MAVRSAHFSARSSEIDLRRPDFLIIGAGKSGTSSLFHYLEEHPQVYVPGAKELNFYSLCGNTNYSEAEIRRTWPDAVTDQAHYLQLFARAGSHQVTGEASPMYLYWPGTAERIRADIPNARLIAILRQPSKRLWSRWLHLARENRTPTERFEDCLDRTSIWWRRPDLITEGFYGKNLEAYYRCFDREQLLVLEFDQFRKHPQQTMQQVFNHLGIPAIDIDTKTNWNKSGVIRNQWIHRLVGGNSVFKSWIHRLSPQAWESLRRHKGLKKQVLRLRNQNLHRPDFDPEVKSALDEIYKEDMLRTQELTQLDLRHWFD